MHRLTGELAKWYDLDAGYLRMGDRADLVVIDPEHLDDSVESYHEAPVPAYDGLRRMVNRNDETVRSVYVSGRKVIDRGVPTGIVGVARTGQFLRAGAAAPAVAGDTHSAAEEVAVGV